MGQPVVNIMKSLGEFGSTGSCVMLTLGYGPININLPILPSNCLKKKKKLQSAILLHNVHYLNY